MSDSGVNRKLAAILALDAVGYSRLMAADEAGAYAALNARLQRHVLSRIVEQRGRVFKTTGDGLLAEFASVVDAVRCAYLIQEANSRDDRDGANAILFRIGVSVGDVILSGEDLYGDGVNVAVRLEGLAVPGGIAMSGAARDHIAGKMDIRFADGGEQLLKNIARPVRVWRWPPDADFAAEAAGAGAERPAIAVLPFANMSNDPEQEYFSDGISEDIITALSRLRWLFVIARNSTFTYKGTSVDVREVARQLGVRYVLEGSVRKAGDRVRVTAQLIDAATGKHVWADRYDRKLDDVFAIQDEITDSVVGSIAPQLYAAEHERVQRKPPHSFDAWDYLIRALFLFGQHSEAGSREALVMLERAQGLDRNYAQAHSLSAFILMWRAFQGWEKMEVSIARGRAATARAMAADAQDPWTHLAEGFIGFGTRQIPEALAAFRRAIDLNPNFAIAHAFLGGAFAFGGQPEEALRSIARGVRLSPRDTFADDYNLFSSFAHFQACGYAEAAAKAELAIRERPEHPYPNLMAASSHALSGNLARAGELATRIKALIPGLSASAVEMTAPFVAAADRARFADGLRRAGLD